MNEELELCVEINDHMYELKTLLPRQHPCQRKIDETMAKYQRYFMDKFHWEAEDETNDS